MAEKPKTHSSLAEQEMKSVEKQMDAYNKVIEDLTLDRMNLVPKPTIEPQTKLSQADVNKSKDIYLRPVRAIGSREQFNEKWRDRYNVDKEYVQFIAENREIIGEAIELWTKPYPGLPAEFWKVPVNKPVFGPRYLADQIKRKFYHRLRSEEGVVTGNEPGKIYYGSLVVDTTVQRLDAIPVYKNSSVFMAAA